MRVILLFLSILLFATAVYSAETPVAKDYFPEERIVNAVICSQYLLSKNNFLSCLNYLVCESEIVKYPKGEKYGFRILIPKEDASGDIAWGTQVWKARLDDTETNTWCADYKKRYSKDF